MSILISVHLHDKNFSPNNNFVASIFVFLHEYISGVKLFTMIIYIDINISNVGHTSPHFVDILDLVV